MLPTPSASTFVGFFLAALGVGMGWPLGVFLITQLTHAIASAMYGS